MQIVIEEIDNMYYADLILSPNDMQKIHQAEMLTSEVIFKHRKCYVGVRLQGSWDYDQEKNTRGDEAPRRIRGRRPKEEKTSWKR